MPIFRSDVVEVDRDVDGSLHLTLDVADRPMNVFNRKVMTDLDHALDAIAVPKARHNLDADDDVLSIVTGR